LKFLFVSIPHILRGDAGRFEKSEKRVTFCHFLGSLITYLVCSVNYDILKVLVCSYEQPAFLKRPYKRIVVMKRKTINRSLAVPVFLFLTVLFASCFSHYPGEEINSEMGSITISFGGNERASAWPPTNLNGVLPNLEHRIKLTGPAGSASDVHQHVVKGVTRVRFSVEPGLWDVEVTAWYDGLLFGICSTSNSVNVQSGQSSPVNIQMYDALEHDFFVVANATDWIDARNAISAGGSGSYIINLTANITVPVGSPSDFTFDNTPGNIIIRGTNPSGSNRTITLEDEGSILRINANHTVTIENLSLVGRPDNTTALVFVEGTLTMNGGTISGNTTSGNGGGVYVSGNGAVFNMRGGTISGNTAGGNGGGVYVGGAGGRFQIADGRVYGANEANVALRNSATNGGAALFVSTNPPGTAQRGTFNEAGAFTQIGNNILTSEDSIIVDGGILQ
jgi:hypothetical protein